METFLNQIQTELLTLAFAFTLVFIAGIAFGYLNGVADGKKTLPPLRLKSTEPEDFNPRTEALRSGVLPPLFNMEAFEKEYRQDVFGKKEADEIAEALKSIFICPECFHKIKDCKCKPC